jgi:acid-sensing ion channel, other
LINMSDGIELTLIYCSHIYYNEGCYAMFEEVVTEDGPCFTYNGLDVYRTGNQTQDDTFKDWTLEDGYLDDTNFDLDVYPRRGNKYPMYVTFSSYKMEENEVCSRPVQGFKIFLHLPNETPDVSKFFYIVPYQQSVRISVSPKMTITDPELRDLPADVRQCYYSDERYLRFFKYYTKSNCEQECVANMTLSKCGCLRFHMPSKKA